MSTTFNAEVVAKHRDVRVTSGLVNLVLLKTAESAFSGFPRDRYTTLRETDERLLATSVTASWRYQIFVATDAPYGLIEATITRG